MAQSCRQREWPLWTAGAILSLLPPASVLSQYVLSVSSGTEACFFRNYTVAYVDWIFVPFNLVVVWTIDWRRGGTLFLIVFVSVIANIVGHAAWQYHGIDGGHMIARHTQIVLPAGWVHLAFSVIEGTLILAFIFASRPRSRLTMIATALGVTFFVAAGGSGYAIHQRFIATDVIMSSAGIALLILYPVFIRWLSGDSQSP